MPKQTEYCLYEIVLTEEALFYGEKFPNRFYQGISHQFNLPSKALTGIEDFQFGNHLEDPRK